MKPQVVVKTAQLLELFRAKFACQDFIHSLGDAVAGVCDRVVFELAHLESFRPLLPPVVGGLHEFHLLSEHVIVPGLGHLGKVGGLRFKVDIRRE